METFPCRECILLCNCSESCDKVLDSFHLLRSLVVNKRCPDCGGEYAYVNISRKNDSENIIGFKILCPKCYGGIAIWMNINNVLRIGNRNHRMPVMGRLTNFGPIYKGIIKTEVMRYKEFIDSYLIPSMNEKYGVLSLDSWKYGKWKENNL